MESHKKVCVKKKYFSGDVMPHEYTKIFEFNQHRKSDKTPSIIYADPESFIKS